MSMASLVLLLLLLSSSSEEAKERRGSRGVIVKDILNVPVQFSPLIPGETVQTNQQQMIGLAWKGTCFRSLL